MLDKKVVSSFSETTPLLSKYYNEPIVVRFFFWSEKMFEEITSKISKLSSVGVLLQKCYFFENLASRVLAR